MKRKNLLRASLFMSLCWPAAPAARAQQPCQPPALAAAAGPNIFSPQQEMDLGDAVAEHVQRDYRVMDDPALSAYLRRVGERVAGRLPPTGLQFRFFIVDLPDVNAFTTPGGRIYVTRKLVAFARNEDELAGVIAHELGHAVTRQPAADLTRIFREVLGVTAVGDRRDVFDKYNQLIESVARKRKAFGRGAGHEEKEQYVADQVGLYALAAAGYDPRAQADFWDRMTENKGDKGGFFSDLFGTTKPEARRLREMLKALAALPASCAGPRAAASPDEFQKWQTAVIAFSGLGGREALHGVVSKAVLEPPLRGDVTHLRFSPDGKYVLAQDDSGINVLSREPFAALFRIDAPEAMNARFTPDSQSVVFYSRALRVEEWNVAERKLKSAKELYVRERCLQTALAPDGKTLACLNGNFALVLYDVASAAQFFQKKDFYKPDLDDLLRLMFFNLARDEDADDAEFDWVSMGFSPDARYFAAGQRARTFGALGSVAELSAAAVDLAARAPLPVNGRLKTLLADRFVFVGPDRIVGLNREDYKKSGIATFPAGEIVEQFPLGGRLAPVTRGDYVMIGGINKITLGVFDLKSKNFVRGSKTSAMDVYDRWLVNERVNGELGLYTLDKNEAVATVVLPRNPLGRLRASAVSADFRWLAVSERSRGAVWDLAKGRRVFHLRGFRGAFIGGDGVLYADFPKKDQQERGVARLTLATGETAAGLTVGESRARQFGPFLALTTPAKKGASLKENVTLEVKDARDGRPLWARAYPKEAPDIWINPDEGTMVLVWAVPAGAAKAEINADPRLKRQLAAMREKEGDYFVQVLDARTGEQLGKLLLETGKGSFRLQGAFVVGDWAVFYDNTNRVHVYSLSTGEQRGRVFGDRAAVAKATGLLAVENERGRLALYDLKTLDKRDEFAFTSPVSLARFSDDGRRLFVLTADQTAYVLNLEEKKE